MALERPKSMDDLTYYSRRKIGDKGKAEVWVFRNKCSCGSIPKKPNMRAKEYVCNCGKITDLKEYEDSLTASIAYTCPSCGNSGEQQMPFKRKKVSMLDEKTGKKASVDSLQFNCEKCGYTINFTKKLKKQVVQEKQCFC